MTGKRRVHKVFVSYHHANDQSYRNRFELLFGKHHNIIESRSVNIGAIHPNGNTEYVRQQIREGYISDATVIVVLIGTHTWQRKHVDWEIYAGLRHTPSNPRCGLLGIFLPSRSDFGKPRYNPKTIPPRLYDNLDNGFAEIYDWTKDPVSMQARIDAAFRRRGGLPKNSRTLFAKNRKGPEWQS